jgi:hypothetical protein
VSLAIFDEFLWRGALLTISFGSLNLGIALNLSSYGAILVFVL